MIFVFYFFNKRENNMAATEAAGHSQTTTFLDVDVRALGYKKRLTLIGPRRVYEYDCQRLEALDILFYF